MPIYGWNKFVVVILKMVSSSGYETQHITGYETQVKVYTLEAAAQNGSKNGSIVICVSIKRLYTT